MSGIGTRFVMFSSQNPRSIVLGVPQGRLPIEDGTGRELMRDLPRRREIVVFYKEVISYSKVEIDLLKCVF